MTLQIDIQRAVDGIIQQYMRTRNGVKPMPNLHKVCTDAVEEPILRATLNYTKGNQSHAARVLGVDRNNLRHKLIHHGIAASDYR